MLGFNSSLPQLTWDYKALLLLLLVVVVIGQFGSVHAMLMDSFVMTGSKAPPGALPSSLLGYEALIRSLDTFGFEDFKSILTVRHSVICFG